MSNSPILPLHATCPHCYCADGSDWSAFDRRGPHAKCCKCGDERARAFLLPIPGQPPIRTQEYVTGVAGEHLVPPAGSTGTRFE